MRVHLLSPGDPTQRTGGYLYNARLVEALRALGDEVHVHAIQGPWPEPVDPILPPLDSAEVVLADGLLWTGLGESARALAQRCPVVVLVHSPLFREGADAETRARLRSREWRALSWAAAVVCTGEPAIRDLPEGLQARCIVPGTEIAGEAKPAGDVPHLVAIANLTERKDHPTLLNALAQVRSRPWTLSLVGSPDRDPSWARDLKRHARHLEIDDRIRWWGELSPEAALEVLATADLLVHTARYEAYGMALAEALALGVPVLSTPAGALEGLPSEAWRAVAPGDVRGIARALAELLDGGLPEAREATRPLRFPSWSEQAAHFRRLFREVCDG